MYYEMLLDYQKDKRFIEYLELNISKDTRELERLQDDTLLDEEVKTERKKRLQSRIKRFNTELEIRNGYIEKLETIISKFDDTEGKIVRARYIDGLKLHDVATKLEISYSHVRRIHAEVVRRLRLIDTFMKI